MTTPTTDIKLPHGEPFADKWDEWIAYRKEIKKPLKSPIAISRCLNQLDVVTEKEAIEMLDTSIRNQYQGIFPLKKNPFEKEETPQQLSKPKVQTLSSYSPKPYDRATGIAFMREKLKKNYEKGVFIKDWGDIYTTLLTEKCGMMIPGGTEQGLIYKCEEEKNRVRNRFEDQYSGSIDSDIRDAKLNWFLDQCRENSRNLSLEI